MFQVEFTQEELKNLVVFLRRTDLKGSEVPAWNAIMQRIQTPIPVETDTDTGTKLEA